MTTASNPFRGSNLTVCYFGTYRAEYSRNIIMIESLRQNGVQVKECHVQLWHNIEDRVNAASGAWRSPKFWLRVMRTYWELLKKYRQIGAYDVMVTGYPGQFDVFLGKWLAKRRGKLLVWDVFMSIYLVAKERGLETRSPMTIKGLKIIEKAALNKPDRLIQDTAEYVEWFRDTYGIKTDRFRLIPTGADNHVYHPIDTKPTLHDRFTVTYYGTFIPNHGVPLILKAAQLLQDKMDVQFELIGTGPEQEYAVKFVQETGMRNVRFIKWLPREELVSRVSETDICLGAFGTTPQSLMTVQNKIYEALAMKLPLVTGDSKTMRNTFVHMKHLYLAPRENPQALADAIMRLISDDQLRKSLAENGFEYFQTNFTVEALGKAYLAHLEELVSN